MTAAPADLLAASRRYVRRIAVAGSSFALGMRLVPEPKRSATYALYAWMRRADDLVDDLDHAAAERRARIDSFWQRTQYELAGGGAVAGDDADRPLWPAFAHTARHYNLPLRHFADLIDGQLMDLAAMRYATFEALRDYCYKVASTVGLLCTGIWGHRPHESFDRMAADRGIAFQLTNILRDIREDAGRGRVYVPDELAGGRIEPGDVLSGVAAGALARAVPLLIEQAEAHYRRSALLDGLVDPDCRPALRGMTAVYRELLGRIAANPRAVIDGPGVRIGRWRKAWIAVRTLCIS